MPILRLLRKYFMPAFVGFAVFSLYNVVDRIFIGQSEGASALAALTAVFPIMLIQMAFGMLVGIGGGVRASIHLGRKESDRAERVLGHALVLLLIVGASVSTFGFSVKDGLLRMFGVSETTYTYASDYLDIILFSSTFSVVGYSLNNFIRAEGNARIAMVSMLISAGLNIILDPIFIFGLGWGVKGAALATLISQFFLASWVILHFTSRRSLLRLRLSQMGFSREITWSIFTVGFSSCALQLAASFVQSTYNYQLVRYGSDVAMGAMGIINSVATLSVMSLIALNQAAQPIFGFNTGAKSYVRVRQTLVYCLFFSTLISVLAFALVELFPSYIIRAFDAKDDRLVEVGTSAMRLFYACFPVVGFQIVVGGYFQAVGMAGKSAILALLRQLLMLIPLILLLPLRFGLTGVWMASPLSDLASALVCLTFLLLEMRKLNAKVLAQQLATDG